MGRMGMRLLVAIAMLALVGGDLTSPTSASGGVDFVLESVIRVNPEEETVTLPVFQGTFAGSPVYYIVTESSSKDDA